MHPTDHTPYALLSATPAEISVRLKKGYRILFLATFRIFPLLLLTGCLIAPNDIQRTLPAGLYWTLLLSLLVLSFILLFYRYTSVITLASGQIILHSNICFFEQQETLAVNNTDELLIVKERGGRSVYWMFYLIRSGKKKKLFHIPIFFSENIRSRDNFADAFKQICGLQVSIKA